MNKHIKKLLEKLFDDDIFNDDDGTLSELDVDKKLSEGLFKNVEELIYNKHFATRKYIRVYPKDNKIYSEQGSDIVAFYYFRDDNGEKDYITYIDFDDVESALTFINYFDEVGIEKVMLQINITAKNYSFIDALTSSNNIVDFKNILFINYLLKGIHPKNLNGNLNEFSDLKSNYPDLYDTFSHFAYWGVTNEKGEKIQTVKLLSVDLYYCYIDESIKLENVDDVTLQECYNMKDYSFIKQVNLSFLNNIYTSDGLPETCNLTGLPTNTSYSIDIHLKTPLVSKEESSHYSKAKNIINFVGVPQNCRSLRIRTELLPWNILPYMSFEGLTMELLPKVDFEASYFPGKYTPVVMQVGPYKFVTKCRRWNPTKPQWQTILTSHDWFLDCYKESTGPHKKYVKPDNDIVDKALKKEQSKIDAANQKTADIIEDQELMVKRLKKYLEIDKTYFTRTMMFKIKEFKENKIQFKLLSGLPGWRTYILDYSAFIKWAENHPFKLDKNDDNSKTFLSAIIDPIVKRRERVNKQRKIDAAAQRKLERELAKKNKDNVVNEPESKVEEPVKQEVKKTIVKSKLNTNDKVKIYDYSDRAIAIYGDYKDMKPYIQLLKDLGCRYNKFLNINGLKQPGWIISSKKRSEVEKILNN